MLRRSADAAAKRRSLEALEAAHGKLNATCTAAQVQLQQVCPDSTAALASTKEPVAPTLQTVQQRLDELRNSLQQPSGHAPPGSGIH